MVRTRPLLLLCLTLLGAATASEWLPAEQESALSLFISEIASELQLAQAAAQDPSAALLKSRRMLKSWAPGQGLGSVQQFLSGLYGANWTTLVPPSWQLPSFTWASLGEFDYGSNLQDFAAAVHTGNITKPTSLAELHATAAQAAGYFCTPEKYVPSQKVFATCVGPKVVLAYAPKVCVLDKASQEVVCDPAKIVLRKSPGGCTHKYMTPAAWSGKQCAITGGVGFSKTAVKGGAPYVLPLPQISASYQP